jgi:hypothetical protein
VKGSVIRFVALICSACIHHPGTRPVTQPPAFAVTVSDFSQSGIALGCLPRAGDSTRFEVDVILDSLRNSSTGAIWLVRRERSAPRLGSTYQAVAVEVERAGRTRVFGTSCWHDAGIVVRGTATVVTEAKVYLDAPGRIHVRVFDGRGTLLVDRTRDLRSSSDRVSWTWPPPNER